MTQPAAELLASSAEQEKVNLLGLSRSQLEGFFATLGEKRF